MSEPRWTVSLRGPHPSGSLVRSQAGTAWRCLTLPLPAIERWDEAEEVGRTGAKETPFS